MTEIKPVTASISWLHLVPNSNTSSQAHFCCIHINNYCFCQPLDFMPFMNTGISLQFQCIALGSLDVQLQGICTTIDKETNLDQCFSQFSNVGVILDKPTLAWGRIPQAHLLLNWAAPGSSDGSRVG